MNKCKKIIISIIKENKFNSNNCENLSLTLSRALRILQHILKNSEKESTSYIKSHQNLRKRHVKYIKAITYTTKLSNCYLNVYENTTMWELKNIIGKKCNIHTDYIQLIISGTEISNENYNKTVADVNYIINEITYNLACKRR